MTVYKTLTPMVSGWDVLAQQRAAAQPQALALFTSDDPILVRRPDGAICDKAGALVQSREPSLRQPHNLVMSIFGSLMNDGECDQYGADKHGKRRTELT